MYETARKCQNNTLYHLRQEMDYQQQTECGRVQMPVLRRKRKKGGLADYILDKLYSIDKHKDDICFLTLVVVVSFFGWQMIGR